MENRKRSTSRSVTGPSVTCPGGIPQFCPNWGYTQSCPGWGGRTPVLSGQEGIPVLGYPPLGTGVPPGRDGPRTSHRGTPGRDMGPVEILWDVDGVPSKVKQTPVKTQPSVIAGGNNPGSCEWYSKLAVIHYKQYYMICPVVN